jgi:hypothetical protein
MTPSDAASLQMGIRHAREAARKASTPQARDAAFRLLFALYGRRWRSEGEERSGLGDLPGPTVQDTGSDHPAPRVQLYTRSTRDSTEVRR